MRKLQHRRPRAEPAASNRVRRRTAQRPRTVPGGQLWRRVGGLLLAGLIPLWGASPPPSPGTNYNLILISLTNTRADHLGVYGYSRNTSPNLDRFAKKCLVFQNAFAHASWTLPASVSLFTSQFPFTHGLMNREAFTPLPSSVPTFLEALDAAGYTTAAFVGDRDYSRPFGHTARFQYLFDAVHTEAQDDWHSYGVLRQTLPPARAWLKQNKDRKFCMLVQGYDTHCPFATPQANRRFDPAYRGGLDFTKCYWTFAPTRPVKMRAPSGEYVSTYLLKTRPQDGDSYEAVFYPEDVHHMTALYDGEIFNADAQLGELFQDLASLGLETNTVVVFYSDHGDMFGKHGRFMRGGPLRGTFYDDVLRMPLLIYHPAYASRTIEGLAQGVDLAPTLLDLLGLKRPEGFQGKSLRPLIEGGPPVNSHVFAGAAFNPSDNNPFFHHPSVIVAARNRQWKLILERVSYSAGPQDSWELYDLRNDPQELTNVAPQRPEVVQELSGVLGSWLNEIKATAFLPDLATSAPPSRKLYWFVPDGLRADPDLFNIYRWAAEGKLPNFKRMMERGAYGFCRPVFPSHTPANFASLFTGCYPEKHGVNDGPMRAEGSPLSQVAVAGFSSAAKKVEPIWLTIEKARRGKIALLSVPGSTPPELAAGLTIRGRWGRWGADFHALNFHDRADLALRKLDPNAARLFYLGPPLTQYIEKRPASGWQPAPPSYSPPLETSLTAWGATLQACICDGTDNQQTDYDTVVFSTNKQVPFCTLKAGQWSGWLPITLKWQIPAQSLERPVSTSCRLKLIRLETNGVFRIRVLYDNLNQFQTEPDYLARELRAGVGPMVDFADNFPPQLIYFPEDKATFLEEATQSLTWHRDAVPFVVKTHRPDVFIFDTYTPNQMLTSRWWLGYVDPASARYNQVSARERAQLWQEVHSLYRQMDDIVGQMLEHADANTFVVVTSDHGAVPIDYQVRLNNLFAKEGLLKFHTDDKTGARVIDWAQTKAVYIQMQNVFLNPAGLAGDWRRASGPAYDQLRRKVKQLLLDLQDERGIKPVEKVVEWERASQEFRLMPERAGDLVIANRAGYGWTEEMTEDHVVFSVPLITGYKQALLPDKVKGVWMPFLMVGPGVKSGHYLGDSAFEIIHQHPTLLHALGVPVPAWVQGRVLTEVFR